MSRFSTSLSTAILSEDGFEIARLEENLLEGDLEALESELKDKLEYYFSRYEKELDNKLSSNPNRYWGR